MNKRHEGVAVHGFASWRYLLSVTVALEKTAIPCYCHFLL